MFFQEPYRNSKSNVFERGVFQVNTPTKKGKKQKLQTSPCGWIQQFKKGSGHFAYPLFSILRCNPIGILSIKLGGWRMISNLLHPLGNSINYH